ncbi:hypothetical protein AVEN_143378-1 [Araneus ventricosus]|uniref:Uncharacterized protein n=1 Tax=Araneus ventricosus TaxID=182803 RepID=A0A4Y2AFH2_ARAVE|nr:hypothetical protein AVEN_143378-1 [Araneus ventricosus]
MFSCVRHYRLRVCVPEGYAYHRLGTSSLERDSLPPPPNIYTGGISVFMGQPSECISKLLIASRQFSSDFLFDDQFWRDAAEFAWSEGIVNVQIKISRSADRFSNSVNQMTPLDNLEFSGWQREEEEGGGQRQPWGADWGFRGVYPNEDVGFSKTHSLKNDCGFSVSAAVSGYWTTEEIVDLKPLELGFHLLSEKDDYF